MKLIIREYLAGLRERNELDAILPDLLSELGLNVISTPGVGTTQYGVDVAAVGNLKPKQEKVYLFSIKAGDLTRETWEGTPQSLRPSLNEIVDAYIPTRIPSEHKDKNIVICLCFGGIVRENVQTQLKGFIDSASTPKISFEIWNGDHLAGLIQDKFLREELMPETTRSLLRKSIALIDEPESSFQHFSNLIQLILESDRKKPKDDVKSIRQVNLCLWIQFSWARETGNIESTYLSSERTALQCWEIVKPYLEKSSKAAKSILTTYDSILTLHKQVCFSYAIDIIRPISDIRDAVSVGVGGPHYIDVNLKLFDVLGRVSMAGMFLNWHLGSTNQSETEIVQALQREMQKQSNSIIGLINNNPALCLPVKDDQAIDIGIAILFLATVPDNRRNMETWLVEMMRRAESALKTKGPYPSCVSSYADLLDHPNSTDEYMRESTPGSILYPLVAIWAAVLGFEQLYGKIQSIKQHILPHCNFQYWFASDDSESHMYLNDEPHGSTLSDIPLLGDQQKLITLLKSECDANSAFDSLSAVRIGYWPLILIACRHYRLPIPIHFLRDLLDQVMGSEQVVGSE